MQNTDVQDDMIRYFVIHCDISQLIFRDTWYEQQNHGFLWNAFWVINKSVYIINLYMYVVIKTLTNIANRSSISLTLFD